MYVLKGTIGAVTDLSSRKVDLDNEVAESLRMLGYLD